MNSTGTGRNGCPEGSVPVASTARPGVNRPGACRVEAIELTRGPDKPGNSRVEVVDSGDEDSERRARRLACWGGGEAPA